MCKKDFVSTNNLLLHCPFARILWNIAFRCLGISWVAFDSIRNNLFTWEDFLGRKVNKTKKKKKKKKAVMVLLHVMFWSFWREK